MVLWSYLLPVSGDQSSSPVEKTTTLGRRCAATSWWPAAARMARSAGATTVPLSQSTSPASQSDPGTRTSVRGASAGTTTVFWPALTSQSSSLATQSARFGRGAPVAT